MTPPNETASDLSSEGLMWKAWHDFHYLCDSSRMQKIFARHRLFLQVKDLPGNIIDAGVFKGPSTLLFAHMLKTYTPHARRKVIGFDTFESTFIDAQPFESERAQDFMGHHEGGALEKLNAVIDAQGLGNYCELIAGDITKTFPQFISDNRGMRISLLHLDLDVYEPTLAVLRTAWDIMVPGGLIILDEYGVEGWGESDAIDAFFREREIRPEIQGVSDSSTPTAIIRVS